MRATLPCLLLFVPALAAQSDAQRRAVVFVERVWDRAPHSAFTDIAHWNGEPWCVFREGSAHVPGTNGVIRVLVERDGAWRSAAVLDEEGVDLRDPKLAVTPDGRLMVLMGGSRYEGRTRVAMRSRVCFFDDGGRGHTELQPVEIDPAIASDHDWLWRVTWHGARAYGAVYQGKPSGSEIHLVTTIDGVRYAHVTRWQLDGRANETTLRFLPDNRLVALVRREEGDRHGRVGVAAPPFTEWTWNELPARLGGPNLLVVAARGAEPTLLAATREYPPRPTAPGTDPLARPVATLIARIGLDGSFAPLLRLPSGGDTSYAGFAPAGDRLHVSYYSSHEGRAAIYRAVLRLPALLELGR